MVVCLCVLMFCVVVWGVSSVSVERSQVRTWAGSPVRRTTQVATYNGFLSFLFGDM